MTLVIVTILVFAFILIATERWTNINKAAVAIFAAAVGWVIYICFGTDFVTSQHFTGYIEFLAGASPTSVAVKHFIAQNIFLPYVGRASEIVLFLLATMTIVEVLYNNECFDFVRQLLKTRSGREMLWLLSSITFIISANLDNLSTTLMMLTIMHGVIPNRRLRMVYGSAIVLSANYGGALTVIGNPEGLVLWNMGAVTATCYSMKMLLPCLVAWGVTMILIQRMLPERIDTEWITMPYRGDDTRLNIWQRLLMLFVGIGGLWFIPTFHNITKLSPFVGALCVLSVLWIVNEILNRKIINTEAMIMKRIPRLLQYSIVQMMLYVMGIMLAIDVFIETGAMQWLWDTLNNVGCTTWGYAFMATLFSTLLDNFATAFSFISLPTSVIANDDYWSTIVYGVVFGGNLLATGSMGGLALVGMERMHVGWFLRKIGWKAAVGGALGWILLWMIEYIQ